MENSPIQNIHLTNADGLTTITFERQRLIRSININADFDLSDCNYIAVGTGEYIKNLVIQHSDTPVFSSECFTLADMKIMKTTSTLANTDSSETTIDLTELIDFVEGTSAEDSISSLAENDTTLVSASTRDATIVSSLTLTTTPFVHTTLPIVLTTIASTTSTFSSTSAASFTSFTFFYSDSTLTTAFLVNTSNNYFNESSQSSALMNQRNITTVGTTFAYISPFLSDYYFIINMTVQQNFISDYTNPESTAYISLENKIKQFVIDFVILYFLI